MERCPVCKARLKGARKCPRCDADFSLAIDTDARARKDFQKAGKAFEQRDPDAMLFHARQAFSKRRTPETSQLLACAAVLSGELDLALRMWAILESGSCHGS